MSQTQFSDNYRIHKLGLPIWNYDVVIICQLTWLLRRNTIQKFLVCL